MSRGKKKWSSTSWSIHTKFQGIQYGHLWQGRGIPMPLWSNSTSSHPNGRQSAGALAWPVAQSGLFQLILVLQSIPVNCAGPTFSLNPLTHAISTVFRGKMLHLPLLLFYPVSFLHYSFKAWWQSPKLAYFVLWKQVKAIQASTQKLFVWKVDIDM